MGYVFPDATGGGGGGGGGGGSTLGVVDILIETVPDLLNLESMYRSLVTDAFPRPQVRVPLSSDGSLTALRVFVASNSLDGTLTVSLLVDGIAVDSIVVPASTTGDFGPSATVVPVSGGQKLSFHIETEGEIGSAELSASVRYDIA